MSTAIVQGYLAEHDDIVNTAKMLQRLAQDRGADLTEPELETIEKGKKRCAEIKRQLDVVGDINEMDAETRDRLMRTGAGQTPGGTKYRTAGALMADCIAATYGSPNNAEHREAKDRYEQHLRAAQHMGTEASLTTPTAGGFGGLFVDPVTGPVIDIYPKGRPFLTAIGVQQAPNSLSFLRPRLVDDDFDTGASAQGLQKAELRSRKFDVSTDTLNLSTVGGYLNVSQQLISLHPSGWDIILRQLQARVTRASELAAIANLVQSTGSVTLATGATAAVTWAALVAGAANVATTTNMPPTWMAFGPLGWKNLAAVTDTTGRPVFPMIGAGNAQGTMSLDGESVGLVGIRPIFTTAITTAHVWFGNELSFEAYAYPFPVLEAVEPSVFGRQVAVAEAIAFYRPVTNSATKVGP